MTFLLEIGTEELPSSHLSSAMRQLKERVPASLQEHRLAFKEIKVYGTPRRMAVMVEGVGIKQVDRIVEAMGPAVRIAYDASGQPTSAAIGFAKGQGVTVRELIRKITEKGEFISVKKIEKGRTAAAVLEELAPGWIRGLEFPKSMRWIDDVKFSRPIRWIVALLDAKLVPMVLAGLKASVKSEGHRFLAPGTFRLIHASTYGATLKKKNVMVDAGERERVIRQLALQATKPYGQPVMSDALVEELAGLVEWPGAVVGKFDESFLKIPRDVLVMVMEKHQRYIPVETVSGELAPVFVVITNGSGKPSIVQAGHERVIRARFSDAEFFYKTDQKTPLGLRVEALKGVVWLEGLGTLYEKTERLVALVGELAEAMKITGRDREAALRAARLAKADQVTEMVKELPELEGVMGAYYAEASGEPNEVVTALKELYWPRGDHHDWPVSPAGTVLNLAERLDHVVGCFVGGKIPTGSEDPFGARRQAVAVTQWALARHLKVALWPMIGRHIRRFSAASNPDPVERQLYEYFHQRVESALADHGVSLDRRRAVLGAGWDPIVETKRRAEALAEITRRPDLAKEIQTFSRVTNILPKVMRGDRTAKSVDPERFQDDAERELHHRFHTVGSAVEQYWRTGEYVKGYEELLKLGPDIDVFFEKVMVMVDDPAVKANRLNLLHQIHLLFLQFADFSQIVLA